MTELWYTEKQTDNMSLSLKITNILHTEVSEYQKIELVDTLEYGRLLIIDGVVMTTERDEFIYHEMITHPVLNTHPNPRKVLVIGGGDGGTIREVVKHTQVQEAVLAEIDARVVEVSRKYLPTIAAAYDDERVRIKIGDGIQHVKDHKNTYDVIIIDSTDPVGPGVGLFTKEFYQSVSEALAEDGMMIAQTESPYVNLEQIEGIYSDIHSIFPIARIMLANIPTYPSGLWCFTIGSKKYDPRELDPAQIPDRAGKYYNKSIHYGAFALPEFLLSKIRAIREGK